MLGRLYSSMFCRDKHPFLEDLAFLLSSELTHLPYEKEMYNMRRKSAFSQISYIHNTCISVLFLMPFYFFKLQIKLHACTVISTWVQSSAIYWPFYSYCMHTDRDLYLEVTIMLTATQFLFTYDWVDMTSWQILKNSIDTCAHAVNRIRQPDNCIRHIVYIT